MGPSEMATSVARLSLCGFPLQRVLASAQHLGHTLAVGLPSQTISCVRQKESLVPSTSSSFIMEKTPSSLISRTTGFAESSIASKAVLRPTTTTTTTTTTPAATRWSTPFRSFASEADPHHQHHQQQQLKQDQQHKQPQHPQPQPQQQPQPHGSSSHLLPRPPHDVVYYGPLAQQHKLLKRISIANTLVAAAAAPAIVAFADNVSLVSRYGLATSLVFFGLATTGALHWVANPYVHELKYTAATGEIQVRTTTLLGSSRWHTFNVDDVQPLPWNRPVATFMARDHFYYIDVYSFPDEDLLRRLTPDEADVPKGYKDKEDDDDD